MSKKKVKLADVLWDAANKRLSHTNRSSKVAVTATCCAAWWAEHGHEWWKGARAQWPVVAKRSQAVQFLKSIGCPVNAAHAFDRIDTAEARQGIRYMWLLLAMHVAEDEGIEIEVEA